MIVSNINVTDYNNDDIKSTRKIISLKLKPFFCCNVISR